MLFRRPSDYRALGDSDGADRRYERSAGTSTGKHILYVCGGGGGGAISSSLQVDLLVAEAAGRLRQHSTKGGGAECDLIQHKH